MQVWRMRTGISITLEPVDRRRLTTVARDRIAPHKHVRRAEIVQSFGGGSARSILRIAAAPTVNNDRQRFPILIFVNDRYSCPCMLSS